MARRLYNHSELTVASLAFWLLVNLAGCGGSAPADTLPSEQAEAVRALESMGAKVSIRDGNVVYVDFYGMPDPAKAVTHLRSLPHVQKLNFSSTNISDEELAQLKDLSSLKELALNRTRVTDKGLVHLAGLKKLEVLNLSEDDVTDAGLVHLENMKQLKQLHLNQTKVTNEGLAHLTGLKQLQWLFVYGTAVTVDGAATFRGQHPGAEVVVTEVDDADVAEPKGE